MQIKHILFPAKGNEFSYLGKAYYYEHKDGITVEQHFLREFYREIDRIVRPWWCPRFLLRAMPFYVKDIILGGTLITHVGWRYNKFVINGFLPYEAWGIAERCCEMIESSNNRVK